MDDLTKQLDGLSLDPNQQHALVEEWLNTTSIGRLLTDNFLALAEEVRGGQFERDIVAGWLLLTQKKRSRYKRSMPPLLYALVFGKEDEKVLREDEALKTLLFEGDIVDFVLNSCSEHTSTITELAN